MNAAHEPLPGKGTPRPTGRWLRRILTIGAIVLGIGFSLSGYTAFQNHREAAERDALDRQAAAILPGFQRAFVQIETIITEGSILAGPAIERGDAGKAELENEMRRQLGALMVGAAVVRASSLEPVISVGRVSLLGQEKRAQRAELARGVRLGGLVFVRRVRGAAGTLIGVSGAAGPNREYGVYVELAVPTVVRGFVANGLRFSLYTTPDATRPAALVFTTGEGPLLGDRSITRDVTLPGLSLQAVVSSTSPLAGMTTRALPWAILALGLLLTALITYLIQAMRSARDDALRLVEEVEAKNAALDATERRYRSLVERLPLVIYTDGAEPGSPAVYVSPQVADVAGVTPEQMIADATLWRQLVHPDDRDRVLGEIAEHLETGVPFRSEYRLIRPDGEVLWIRDVGIFDDADGERVINGYWEDITERKLLEGKLHEAQRLEAVGRLAGGISHDFNNILNVISVSSDFLLDATPVNDPRREDIEEIRRAAERAAGLTKQLVAFSRRQVLRPELVEVNETVLSMDRMLSRIFGPSVRLETHLGDDPCWVEVDPGQLEQVIVNLAVNARDAMPGGGVVTLVTEHAPLDDGRDGVAIVVSDTGHGIDEATQQRIFEPFYTTKDPDKGTGLGLASVYGIVQQSGGTISVASAPGDGASFRVLLPAATSTEPVPPLGGPVPVSGDGVRLLLVEDNDDVRRATTRILERLGHSVLVATDGLDALDLIDGEDPVDLVVTDVLMPRLGGIELAQRLRERNPMLPVVFMSGYPGPDSDGTIVTDERMVFLQKPFGPGELADAVAQLITVSRNGAG